MGRGKVWELCIYAGGTAILADEDGNTVWTSDSDDEFCREFDDALTFEDGDDIAQYLEDEGIMPAGIALDIVEADDSGLNPVLSGDLDDNGEELDENDEDDE